MTSTTGGKGAICPAATSGDIVGTISPTFPAGAFLIFTVSATVDADQPASVTNTVTITPPTDGGCVGGSPTDPCTVIVTVNGQWLAFTGMVQNGLLPLALLSLMVGGLLLVLRSRRRNALHAQR